MGKWKQLITEGNHLFHHQQFDKALSCYENAKARAHMLFQIWPDADAAVSALVVSYHNVADAYARQGHCHIAYSELKEIHSFLSNELSASNANEAKQNAILQGISKADIELAHFIGRHKQQPMTHARATLTLS